MGKATDSIIQLFAGRRANKTAMGKDVQIQKTASKSSKIIIKPQETGTDNMKNNNSEEDQNTKVDDETEEAAQMEDNYDHEEMKQLKAKHPALWRKKSQEQAWKLILENPKQRPTLADHFQAVRKPGPWEKRGYEALSPEAKTAPTLTTASSNAQLR